MSSLRLQLLVCLFAATPLVAKTQVFHNARVPLLDPKNTIADWIAVTDGKIVGYGIKEHFETFEAAEKIDLHGKTLTPRSRVALGQSADFLR